MPQRGSSPSPLRRRFGRFSQDQRWAVVALNIGVHSFIALAIPWANLADGLRARGYLSPSNLIAVPAAVIIGYAGVMLWLGGRMLARFQATGGMAGDDLLMAGPDVMPGAGPAGCAAVPPERF